MTPPPSDDTISFDVDKFYLGTLCKRGHDFHGCGYSLRYLKGRYCKECSDKNSRKWKKSNPEKVCKINNKWRKANPEKDRESKRKSRRKYYKANYDKILEQNRKYYRVNSKKILERRRKYYKANREKYQERNLKWKMANPIKVREYDKKRHLKKAQNKLLTDLFKFQQLLQEQGVNLESIRP